MSMDFWAVAALADELRDTALSGRVQQVVQADACSLALELYAGHVRRYLLLSADQQAPRIHMLSAKPRRGAETESALLQLMRKYVRGARLSAISQPPWERILHLDFQHPEHGDTRLTLELIGRWANLLLLRQAAQSDGQPAWRILDCVHRYRAEAGRAAQPGQWYQPPPAQNGLSPRAVDVEQAQRLLAAANETPLWRVLVAELQGISPQAAREVAARADNQAHGLVAAIAWLTAHLDTAAWQPCVLRHTAGTVTAYAPYALTHRAETAEAVASISRAVELAASGAVEAAPDGYAAARSHVAAAIDRAEGELRKRRDALQRQLRPVEEIQQQRASGEWILALAHSIAPRQTVLPLPPEVMLPPVTLDPALSPAQNAAAYFKRYRKARRASTLVIPRLEQIAGDLAYLEQLHADLALAADRAEIDAVRAALAEAGFARRRKQGRGAASPAPQGPRRFLSVEGYTIWVGRNSRQNDRVTFDVAGPDDLWLHVRGLPGSHVVIRNGGQAVSEATVAQAARLAAHFSKARGEAWAEVIVAERRFVRRAPGRAHPGMVTVSKERVVAVHEPARIED